MKKFPRQKSREKELYFEGWRDAVSIIANEIDTGSGMSRDDAGWLCYVAMLDDRLYKPTGEPVVGKHARKKMETNYQRATKELNG